MAQRINQNAWHEKLTAHRQFSRGVPGGERLVLKLHDAAELIFAKRDISWSEMAGTDLRRCIFF